MIRVVNRVDTVYREEIIGTDRSVMQAGTVDELYIGTQYTQYIFSRIDVVKRMSVHLWICELGRNHTVLFSKINVFLCKI